MSKSLVELRDDMESARLATIKEGQRNNAIVKKIFSSRGDGCLAGEQGEAAERTKQHI